MNDQTWPRRWISSRVANQKLFNRYDWHSGRSIVFSLSLSLSRFPVLPLPLPVPQGDASVVRKRKATRTVGGLEGTNGGCPEGTLTQAPLLSETIVLLPRSLSLDPFPSFLRLRHRWLLISWLKMSDTRTRSTERVHPRRITGTPAGRTRWRETHKERKTIGAVQVWRVWEGQPVESEILHW